MAASRNVDFVEHESYREPVRTRHVSKEMKRMKLEEAFREAARDGELHVMHMLMKESLCDVECTDEEGNSALLLVCATGNLVVMRYLAQMGAALDATNGAGWNALHQACYHGHEDIVRTLMEMRPELVNKSNNNGSYPLHTAVASGNYNVTRYLLIDRRARIDARNITGDTPLHFAVVCKQPEIAALLVEHGAPPGALNEQNQTPLDDAIATGQGQLLRMMLSSTIRLMEDDKDSDMADIMREREKERETLAKKKKKKKKTGLSFDVTFSTSAKQSTSKGKKRSKKRKAKGDTSNTAKLPTISTQVPFVEVGGVRIGAATSTMAHMMTSNAVMDGKHTNDFVEKLQPTFKTEPRAKMQEDIDINSFPRLRTDTNRLELSRLEAQIQAEAKAKVEAEAKKQEEESIAAEEVAAKKREEERIVAEETAAAEALRIKEQEAAEAAAAAAAKEEEARLAAEVEAMRREEEHIAAEEMAAAAVAAAKTEVQVETVRIEEEAMKAVAAAAAKEEDFQLVAEAEVKRQEEERSVAEEMATTKKREKEECVAAGETTAAAEAEAEAKAAVAGWTAVAAASVAEATTEKETQVVVETEAEASEEDSEISMTASDDKVGLETGIQKESDTNLEMEATGIPNIESKDTAEEHIRIEAEEDSSKVEKPNLFPGEIQTEDDADSTVNEDDLQLKTEGAASLPATSKEAEMGGKRTGEEEMKENAADLKGEVALCQSDAEAGASIEEEATLELKMESPIEDQGYSFEAPGVMSSAQTEEREMSAKVEDEPKGEAENESQHPLHSEAEVGVVDEKGERVGVLSPSKVEQDTPVLIEEEGSASETTENNAESTNEANTGKEASEPSPVAEDTELQTQGADVTDADVLLQAEASATVLEKVESQPEPSGATEDVSANPEAVVETNSKIEENAGTEVEVEEIEENIEVPESNVDRGLVNDQVT